MEEVKKLLREPQQAEILQIAPRTLRDWRLKGLVPFYKIQHTILYDPLAVQQAFKRLERVAK